MRGYPLDSNVKGHGIRPSGASAGKGIFVLDTGAVKGDVVAEDETVRVGAKGDEAGGGGGFSKQSRRDPSAPCVVGGGDSDDGVWMSFLWHSFWDAVMCWASDRLPEASAEPVVVLCTALLGDVPF